MNYEFRPWIAALLLLAASHASAAHKCLGEDGVTRYQELPCTTARSTGVVMTPDQQRYQQRMDELRERLEQAEKQVEERRRLAAEDRLDPAKQTTTIETEKEENAAPPAGRYATLGTSSNSASRPASTYQPTISSTYRPTTRSRGSQTTHTGPRGGKYVITSSGKKRYVGRSKR